MIDSDEQRYQDLERLRQMGLPAALAALDLVEWQLDDSLAMGDSLDALFNRLAWHSHFALMEGGLAYDWTITYGPTYARAFAKAAVLGAFPNELEVPRELRETNVRLDRDETVLPEQRTASLAQLIYAACGGLFAEGPDGRPVPDRSRQIEFLHQLEALGVARSAIVEVLWTIPGPWLEGWPREYRAGHEAAGETPQVQVRRARRRNRPES